MHKYYFKIDYLYNGQEDFLIISSSDLLDSDQIIEFAIGARNKKLFEAKEIWELNFDEGNKLIPLSLKTKLL